MSQAIRQNLSGPELPVRCYTPGLLMASPLGLAREMIADLWRSRSLAYRLTVRDLNSQYRQSYLGRVWAILPPIISAMTFAFLNQQGVLNIETPGVPYVVFAFIGSILWAAFTEALSAPQSAFASARGMITRINFPREAILLSAVAKLMVGMLIKTVIVLVVLAVMRIPFHATLLLAPVGWLALSLLGFSIGLFTLPLATLYSDVGRAISMGTGFLMFLTPVIYPPKTDGTIGLISSFNPISPLLVTTRQWMLGENLTQFPSFIFVIIGSFLIAGLGWIIFRVSMPHLIARLG